MKTFFSPFLIIIFLIVSCTNKKNDQQNTVEYSKINDSIVNTQWLPDQKLKVQLEDYFINKSVNLKEISTPFYFDFITESIALSINPEPTTELEFTKKYNDVYNVSQTGYPSYFLVPQECVDVAIDVEDITNDTLNTAFRVTLFCKANNKSYRYEIKTASTQKIDAVKEL